VKIVLHPHVPATITYLPVLFTFVADQHHNNTSDIFMVSTVVRIKHHDAGVLAPHPERRRVKNA
jgi:hypothetical protein